MNKRKLILEIIDVLCFAVVYCFVHVLSAMAPGGTWKLSFQTALLNFLVLLGIAIVARAVLRVYRNIWRFANSYAYLSMVMADGAAALAGILITRLMYRAYNSYYFGGWQTLTVYCLFCLLTLTSRFVYQQLKNKKQKDASRNKINVVIVGAGNVGVLLAQELLANKRSHYKPYCFIDNDTHKVGSMVSGLKVYPENADVIDLIKSMPVQEIFLALPKMTGERIRDLHDFYSKTECKVKIYDVPVSEDGNPYDENGKRVLKDVRIEDLLFRDSLAVGTDTMRGYYSDKTVLVTGGGGSIGSELCRQIAKCHPKKLVILDIYENNAYDISQELIRKYGEGLDITVEIASVRDRQRLDCIFAHYRPDIVFHAAAHKHVPLMEHSNCEAIKNNVMGTYNTADMAEKYGVNKFILISTDKAVNPTNIMGASKRMCEMVVQCRADSATSFVAVRFGNVLGSNGSVIPLFRRQIESGGPVTITDKRIIRYFMTIPEASQLVMQAGAIAQRGELFVLDMGKPVKILDLAENMIRLSGMVPYEDIDIVEVGLRPGEKLYEELLVKSEELDKTENKMIFIERDKPFSREAVEEKIRILLDAVEASKGEVASAKIREAMKQVVPTYHDPEEVNRNAEHAAEMEMVTQ